MGLEETSADVGEHEPGDRIENALYSKGLVAVGQSTLNALEEEFLKVAE